MLELRDICLAYAGHPLLERISFTLGANEILALLGPSGTGKTSLLRIIAGLDEPGSGSVSWNGISLSDVPTEKRNFGLVFQDYALFPHLNVADNIGFGLRMQGADRVRRKERIAEMLHLIGLPGWEQKRVDYLSGGEQQRVALARALAVQPRLLMLDEPLNALDKVLRTQLAEEIRRILTQSRTPAIYVTHDQEEAFAIATRVAILHDGRILQDDVPQRLLRYPNHEWIVNFLGLGSVVDGIVHRKKTGWLETPLGKLPLPPATESILDGETVKVLLRTEAGSVRKSRPREKGWIAGSVVRTQLRGNSARILIALPGGVEIWCEGDDQILVGDQIWWKSGEANIIRVLDGSPE